MVDTKKMRYICIKPEKIQICDITERPTQKIRTCLEKTEKFYKLITISISKPEFNGELQALKHSQSAKSNCRHNL